MDKHDNFYLAIMEIAKWWDEHPEERAILNEEGTPQRLAVIEYYDGVPVVISPDMLRESEVGDAL